MRSVDVAVPLVAGSSLNKKSQFGHCRGLCLDQGRLKTWVCGVLVAAVGIWICGVLVAIVGVCKGAGSVGNRVFDSREVGSLAVLVFVACCGCMFVLVQS